MKIKTILYSLALLIIPAIKGFSTNIDRTTFYAAMKSEDLAVVESQLTIVEKDTTAESRAFEGALLMKKAGLLKGAFKKLKIFKQGRTLLEVALQHDSTNAEYRFLRLMIQENAPGILNYNDDLKTDSAMVQSAFKDMPDELQQIITEYSRSSKVLNTSNL